MYRTRRSCLLWSPVQLYAYREHLCGPSESRSASAPGAYCCCSLTTQQQQAVVGRAGSQGLFVLVWPRLFCRHTNPRNNPGTISGSSETSIGYIFRYSGDTYSSICRYLYNISYMWIQRMYCNYWCNPPLLCCPANLARKQRAQTLLAVGFRASCAAFGYSHAQERPHRAPTTIYYLQLLVHTLTWTHTIRIPPAPPQHGKWRRWSRDRDREGLFWADRRVPLCGPRQDFSKRFRRGQCWWIISSQYGMYLEFWYLVYFILCR